MTKKRVVVALEPPPTRHPTRSATHTSCRVEQWRVGLFGYSHTIYTYNCLLLLCTTLSSVVHPPRRPPPSNAPLTHSHLPVSTPPPHSPRSARRKTPHSPPKTTTTTTHPWPSLAGRSAEAPCRALRGNNSTSPPVRGASRGRTTAPSRSRSRSLRSMRSSSTRFTRVRTLFRGAVRSADVQTETRSNSNLENGQLNPNLHIIDIINGSVKTFQTNTFTLVFPRKEDDTERRRAPERLLCAHRLLLDPEAKAGTFASSATNSPHKQEEIKKR